MERNSIGYMTGSFIEVKKKQKTGVMRMRRKGLSSEGKEDVMRE